MKESQYEFWIEADGKGFFDGLSFDATFQLPSNYREDPALLCAFALDRAKQGDFSLVPATLNVYGKTGRPIVDAMALGAIGYAGPTSCFSRVVDIVRRERDLNRSVDYCGVMAIRGELSYIPIFLDKYLENQDSPNAEYMLDYIRSIVGDDEMPVDPEEFEEEMLACYQRMLDKFGSEDVLLFHGETYSVARLAHYIQDAADKPFFLSSLRRRFEAATGLNCSSWYRDKILRPLAVVATIEEFLESPAAEAYEDGARYFFGHRIP